MKKMLFINVLAGNDRLLRRSYVVCKYLGSFNDWPYSIGLDRARQLFHLFTYNRVFCDR